MIHRRDLKTETGTENNHVWKKEREKESMGKIRGKMEGRKRQKGNEREGGRRTERGSLNDREEGGLERQGVDKTEIEKEM